MKKIFFLITFLLSVCPTNAQTIKDIKGRWKGSYFCSQGETGLTMKIKPISDKEFIGTFKFYPIKTNLSPTVKSGKIFHLKELFLLPIKFYLKMIRG